MSKEKNRKKTPNFIENADLEAKKLFGYDDESLLQEFEEAEQELERMKLQDPELEQKLKAETDAGLAPLMAQIHEAGLKPVAEKEYEEKEQKDNRKVISLKPLLKVMLVAAAVMVVLMGMGISASAGKIFEYRKIKVGDVKNKVRWDNEGFSQERGELQEVYEQIQDTMGINVLRMKYIPVGMEFETLSIDKGHATIQLQYNGKKVYFKQTKYIVDQVSDNLISDRDNIAEKVYNRYLSEEIPIEKNEIKKGFIEYSVSLNRDDVYYYFSSTAKLEEFKKMVKNLSFE